MMIQVKTMGKASAISAHFAVRDVIVVGGGPAGSALSSLLARQGFDVLLVDRARFPRDKPCGEFLTPGVERILRGLGVWDSLPSAGVIPASGVSIQSPDTSALSYEPPDGAPAGWCIRRTELDARLIDHARASGVEVREGKSVRALMMHGRRVVGVRSGDEVLRARLVVGADGTHSRVARDLGLVRPIRRLQRIAIVSHWHGVCGDANLEMRARDGIVCGLSVLKDGEANVTLVVSACEAGRIGGHAASYLRSRLAESFPEVVERLAGAQLTEVRTTACFGHTCRRASAAGALLVGDAATFIDPFTGEGIYFALRGAEIAAEVAGEALRAGDVSESSLARYDKARRELDRRYRLCDIVQAVVHRPWLMDRAIRALSARPALAGRLMRVLADQRPPGDALNPRFVAQLLAAAY